MFFFRFFAHHEMYQTTVATESKAKLTSNQIRGFWASAGGWALDAMDSYIYALVLVPALRDLLPRSGIATTPGNIGLYGGILFSVFLIGWGLSFLAGPIADRFGRVRTLMATILCAHFSHSWEPLRPTFGSSGCCDFSVALEWAGNTPSEAPLLPKSGLRSVGARGWRI